MHFFFFLLLVARNNLFYVCIGLGIGTTCGYMIGCWVARPYYPSPVMKAVACLALKDPDVSFQVSENRFTSYEY